MIFDGGLMVVSAEGQVCEWAEVDILCRCLGEG